jgi:hypothetical protein
MIEKKGMARVINKDPSARDLLRPVERESDLDRLTRKARIKLGVEPSQEYPVGGRVLGGNSDSSDTAPVSPVENNDE